jgi:hypothetical protein
MIRGIPMAKERLRSDVAEIELYYETLTGHLMGVPVALYLSLTTLGFRIGPIDWKE